MGCSPVGENHCETGVLQNGGFHFNRDLSISNDTYVPCDVEQERPNRTKQGVTFDGL